MNIPTKKFRNVMRSGLSEAVEVVFDTGLSWMAEEITSDWRCFFSREIWFEENLPEPLINEKGRLFEIERLRAKIGIFGVGAEIQPAPSKFVEDYRNYLDPGPLDVCEADGRNGPRDLVANSVTDQLLRIYNRHFWFETMKNEQLWREEAAEAHCASPPADTAVLVQSKSERNNGLVLERDVAYWIGLYRIAQRQVTDLVDFSQPDTTIDLMRRVVPDFELDVQLSNASALWFCTTASSSVKWAVVFEKIGALFDYPPRLVLIAAELPVEQRKKLGPDDFLFVDVIGSRRLALFDRRDMELSLRFTLQRYRRAMRFYEPFVARALNDSFKIM